MKDNPLCVKIYGFSFNIDLYITVIEIALYFVVFGLQKYKKKVYTYFQIPMMENTYKPCFECTILN